MVKNLTAQEYAAQFPAFTLQGLVVAACTTYAHVPAIQSELPKIREALTMVPAPAFSAHRYEEFATA